MSLKIQFGSGGNILPGWVNTDLQYAQPELRVDITKPLPWKDGVVMMILIEHCLEHVSGPDALRFLDECYRILEPNGLIRVCVPAIDRIAEDFMPVEMARDDVLNHGHLIFFSTDSLICLLRIAGFRHCTPTGRKPMDGHWTAIGKERDDLETLRMEAVK